MYDSMESTSSWSALYFVVLLVFGNFLVLSLFVAILLTNFGAQEIGWRNFVRHERHAEGYRGGDGQ